MLARWEDDFSVAAILASEAPKRGPNTASASSGSGRASAKHSPITGVSPGVSPSITPAGTPAASPQLGASSRSRLRVPGGSVFVDSPSTSPQASPRHHGGGNLFGAPVPMPAAASSSRAARSSAPAVLESNRTRAPLSNPFAALDDEDDDQPSDDDDNNNGSDNDD